MLLAVTAALFYHTCSRMLKGGCSRCWWRHFFFFSFSFFFFFFFCPTGVLWSGTSAKHLRDEHVPNWQAKTGSCGFSREMWAEEKNGGVTGNQQRVAAACRGRHILRPPCRHVKPTITSTQRSRRHRQLNDITTLNPQIKGPESNQL